MSGICFKILLQAQPQHRSHSSICISECGEILIIVGCGYMGVYFILFISCMFEIFSYECLKKKKWSEILLYFSISIIVSNIYMFKWVRVF